MCVASDYLLGTSLYGVFRRSHSFKQTTILSQPLSPFMWPFSGSLVSALILVGFSCSNILGTAVPSYPRCKPYTTATNCMCRVLTATSGSELWHFYIIAICLQRLLCLQTHRIRCLTSQELDGLLTNSYTLKEVGFCKERWIGLLIEWAWDR